MTFYSIGCKSYVTIYCNNIGVRTHYTHTCMISIQHQLFVTFHNYVFSIILTQDLQNVMASPFRNILTDKRENFNLRF